MALGSIGKYEKLDVLGHGISGIVYLAWDKLLGRHIALKEISLQAADEERFLEEARVLDRLRHPNIVQVNGVDRVDGCLVIDMEYVRGTNLHEYLRWKGKLPAREALTIAVNICNALDFAHRNHTVHRDIKPANIMISQEGDVKIGDFGLAEILGSGSYAGGAGTYAYMAPEDFDEEQRSDFRSDIWSIGVTLYEMLSGVRPFRAPKPKDPFSWKRTVSTEEPVALIELDPSLPVELVPIVEQSLAKDKRNRYESAGRMGNDLQAILMALGGPVKIALQPGVVYNATASDLSADIPQTAAAEIDIKTTPQRIDFGRMRKGDSAREKLKVHAPGRGKIEGRIAAQPGWISVEPQHFQRRKQRFIVTANTESVWQPGDYDEYLTLEIDGDRFFVPISVTMLPQRRRFYEAAWWYLPLLILTLLPLFANQGKISFSDGPGMAPLTAAGLLSIMLFIITIVADLGIWEKIIPAIVGAVGLGIVSGSIWQAFSGKGISALGGDLHMPVIGSILSLFVALQLLTAARWRMWSVLLALLSICTIYVLIG